MTKPNHSPAPWGGKDLAVLDAKGNLITRLAKILAETDETQRSLEKQQAVDAALIRAAPKMLAQLRRWHKFAVDNGYTDADYQDSDGTGWMTETGALIDAIENHYNPSHTDIPEQVNKNELHFSDGYKFATRGRFRISERADGLYVIGDDILVAVGSYEEGNKLIASLDQAGSQPRDER
jgi:hypothetical protein